MTNSLKKARGGISYLARPQSGATVLFLHGIGANAASFLPIVDELPAHLNLLMWNAPGYLDSDPVDDPWPTPETYADRLLQFLDDLDIPSVHVVGHSLGTLIATSFARRHPDRLESLVLASAAQGHGVSKGGVMPAKVLARIDDLNRLGPKAFAKARAANLVHEPAENASLVARIEAAMSEVTLGDYAQAVRLLASGDLSADLRQVPTRPGFITGTEDRITPIEQTLSAASAWEDAHASRPGIRKIEGAGHAVYLQKPKEFCAALVTLLPSDAGIPHSKASHHEEV